MWLHRNWEYLKKKKKEVRRTKIFTFMELFSCREEKNSQKNLTNECVKLKLAKCSKGKNYFAIISTHFWLKNVIMKQKCNSPEKTEKLRSKKEDDDKSMCK